MFKDNHPKKWLLLGTLLAIILLGLVLFFGMQAQAANKYLPIKDIKTPGGLSVWLVEDHTLPVISVRFAFVDSGTALDPEDKQGLVRMLSNTMDEGAGELDSQSFQKSLADNSITLVYSATKDGFYGELKTLSRNKDKAFELLALSMNAPRFDEEPVARMRDGNLTRIKSSLSEPDWMAARLLNDKAFEGHPYSKNSGGTLSSLGKITADDLRNFKKSYLTKDRLRIAAAGDIDEKTLSAAIDKAFGNLSDKASVGVIADTIITNGGKVYLYEQPIPQTVIEVTGPAFDQKDKDYYALQLMNYVFGGAGFGSYLMDSAREQKGLTYGIYSNTQDMRHADTIGISTSTKNESVSEMLSIIKDQMAKMRDTKVSDQQLRDAKSYITGSIPLALTETDDISSMLLGLLANDLPIDYLDNFSTYINAVTADDIQRVAKRILKPESMLTVLVGKPENTTAEIVKELPNVK